MLIRPHTLPCGCRTDGWPCDEHRRGDDASDLASAVALALFLACIAIWAAILSG